MFKLSCRKAWLSKIGVDERDKEEGKCSTWKDGTL